MSPELSKKFYRMTFKRVELSIPTRAALLTELLTSFYKKKCITSKLGGFDIILKTCFIILNTHLNMSNCEL